MQETKTNSCNWISAPFSVGQTDSAETRDMHTEFIFSFPSLFKKRSNRTLPFSYFKIENLF